MNSQNLLNDIEQSTAPYGSDLYYALRFAKHKDYPALLTCFALHHALTSIPYVVSDPGTARIKRRWWQDEIQNLFSNQTVTHPILKLMSEQFNEIELQRVKVESMLDFSQTALDTLTFSDEAQRLQYCEDKYLPLLMLTQQISKNTHSDLTEVEQTALKHGAQFLGLFDIIVGLRLDLQRGSVMFADETLARFGLSKDAMLDALTQASPDEALASSWVGFLQAETAQAQSLFATYRSQNSALSPILKILLGIKKSQLDMLANEKIDPFKTRVQLSPLYKLWLSYKYYWG